MEIFLKSCTKFLQEACRLYVVLAPYTYCFLFYLSFTTRRCYICLIKVLEDTLYLMFYDYKACITQPPIAKEACFWVYRCGNNLNNGTTPTPQQQVDITPVAFTLEWFLQSIYSPSNSLSNTKLGNHSKNCISKL